MLSEIRLIYVPTSSDIFASTLLKTELSPQKYPNVTDVSWLHLRTAFQSHVFHNKLFMWKIYWSDSNSFFGQFDRREQEL